MRFILLLILLLLLIGALPTWPYSTGWGYYPSGGLGLILLIPIILALMGRLRSRSNRLGSGRALRRDRFLQRIGRFARSAARARVRVSAELVPVNPGIVSKRVHRNPVTRAAGLQMAM